MSSAFGSFDGSPFGAFIRSPLKARNQGVVSKVVAVGQAGIAMLSGDGTAWASQSPPSDDWASVCWSPSLSLFVAVGSGTTHYVMTSPDGVTWTARTAAENNPWVSVCWSPDLSLFVAVANFSGPTGHRAMTSPDGVTWTARTLLGPFSAQETWSSVAWSSALGKFIAVYFTSAGSLSGAGYVVSSDGVTWTGASLSSGVGADRWSSICWSPDLARFCAVADSGGTNYVMTSPDGITWTNRTALNGAWKSVCWSSSLALFVATGGGGSTSSYVMTSPDGITWTVRTPAESAQWKSVCWSPLLNLFMAVVDVPVTYDVMTSPDGINWTGRAPVGANPDPSGTNGWFSVVASG